MSDHLIVYSLGQFLGIVMSLYFMYRFLSFLREFGFFEYDKTKPVSISRILTYISFIFLLEIGLAVPLVHYLKDFNVDSSFSLSDLFFSGFESGFAKGGLFSMHIEFVLLFMLSIFFLIEKIPFKFSKKRGLTNE